jgi:hypothetical protein
MNEPLQFYEEFTSTVTVEGRYEDLIAAGVLNAEDPVPRRPRGCIERGFLQRWLKISMTAKGTLRVRGRGIEAAKADKHFQRFMVAATTSRRPPP